LGLEQNLLQAIPALERKIRQINAEEDRDAGLTAA
jgi:hypothetical protein